MHKAPVAPYVLSDTEKANVESVVLSKVPVYRPESFDIFMLGCRSASEDLPSGIREWKEQVQATNVGLIRNLPLDLSLPATPNVRHGADDISLLADGVIGTISALFGSLYTIEGKTTGRHIHNIHPIVGDELTQLGSSQVELEWHVEDGFHLARPDWVSLLCLRSDAEAETKLARAQDLRLPPDILPTLRDCRFKLRIDDSFGDETHATYVTTSILTGPTTDLQIVFDPAYTVCEGDDAATLAAVGSAAEEVHQRLSLANGDLLIFNNRRVLHARSAYHPRMDGTDRWLKRGLILDAAGLTSPLKNGVICLALDLL